MAEKTLDRIHIRDLQLRCIIGIFPEERREKQDVIINITLYADLQSACQTDDIDDTVDYKKIKKNVLKLVENSECNLVERLAESIAEVCLQDDKVERVKVAVDKPNALRFARSVAIEIVRERQSNE